MFNKKILGVIIIALIGILCLPQQSSASHLMAADIFYNCIDSCRYEITIRLYRDCDGVSAPADADISFSSSCGSFNYTLPKVAVKSGVDVSQLCSSVSSTCEGGTYAGTEIHVYSDTINICNLAPSSPFCSDWKISWSGCCRNSDIDNLTSTGSQYFYTTLDNASGDCYNSAPDFNTLPTPYICRNQRFCYNPGTVDPDGDSLSYTIIRPKEDPSSPIDYSSPYDTLEPLPTGGTFCLDQVTGEMCFTPSQQGQFVIAFLVEQWRDSVKVDESIREMQIIVENCTNNQPQFDSVYNVDGGIQRDTSSGGGGKCSNTSSSKRFDVCPGDTLSFDFSFSDLDTADTLYLSSNISSALPPGANIIKSGENPLKVDFKWSPTVTDTGNYSFVVKVSDSSCAIPGINYSTFYVNVFRGTKAFPTFDSYCDAEDSIQLLVKGGDSFTWSPAAGLSCTNCADPKAAPDTTTDYIVQSSLSNACRNSDTVTVRKVPDIKVSSFPQDTAFFDTSVCKLSTVPFQTLVTPANQSPFIYNWEPSWGLSQDSIPNPILSATRSQAYSVSITSDSGCTVEDTVAVEVKGTKPNGQVQPDPLRLCQGDTAQFLVGDKPWVCGTQQAGCATDSTRQHKVGSGTNSTNTATPFDGKRQDSRIQILYRQSELKSAGLTAGTIKEIGFKIASQNSLIDYRNFTIKMGCTAANSLKDNFQEGLAEVFGPTSYGTSSGWNTYRLTTPYNWDGNSNLIVEICYDNNSSTNSDPVNYTLTGFNSVLKDEGSGKGCSLSNPTSMKRRPNIQLTICPLASTDSLDMFWSPTTGLDDPFSDQPNVSVSNDITYEVYLNDNGCRDTTQARVNVLPIPRVQAQQDTFLCTYDTLDIAILPDTNIYNYHWYPSLGLSDTNIAEPNVNLVNTDNSPHTYSYQVQAIDTLGVCRNTDSFDLTVYPRPQLNSKPADTLLCSGSVIQLNATDNQSYDYTWSPSYNTSHLDSSFTNIKVENSTNSTQQITYFVKALDSMGCRNVDSTTLRVRPLPEVFAGRDTTIRINESALLNASVIRGTKFNWQPDQNLTCTNCLMPMADPEQTTTYTLYTRDNHGCESSDSVQVKVVYPPFEMPNAFTPNGDGVNEEIRPRGGNVVEYEYRVYNRWGELVFQTNDPQEGWDGTNQNGKPQPIGTYVYYIQAIVIKNETQKEEKKTLKGNITLIR